MLIPKVELWRVSLDSLEQFSSDFRSGNSRPKPKAARGGQATLVTSNPREFARVAGLQLEDWTS